MMNKRLVFKSEAAAGQLQTFVENVFVDAFLPGWSIIDDTHQKALLSWLELYTASSRRAMLNILDFDDVRNLSEGSLNSLFESVEDGRLAENMMVYRNGLTYKGLIDFCREWLRENPGDDSPKDEAAE